MNVDARHKLLHLMQSIFEDGYRAGWMPGYENKIWLALLQGPSHFGQTYIDQATIDQLKLLSQQANGWWIYDEQLNELSFIALPAWRNRFSPEQARYQLAEVIDDIKGSPHSKNHIYFIHDGRCSLYMYIAHVLSLKNPCSQIVFVNADKQKDHPLLAILDAKKIDINKGIVIFYKRKLYRKISLLKFIASQGIQKTKKLF